MRKATGFIKKFIGLCSLGIAVTGLFTTIFFVFDSVKGNMKTSDIIITVICGLLPVSVLCGFLSYCLLRKIDPNKTQAENEVVENNLEIGAVEPNQTEYVLTDNVIYRADGNPIEENEITYLKELGLEKAGDYYKSSKNPKFHRAEVENELSFQFVQHHGAESGKLCNTFIEINRAAEKTNDIKEKIRLLNQAVEKFEQARQWHYNISTGGMIYFQDVYEYMHNSQNDCFSWVDIVKQKLFELEKV